MRKIILLLFALFSFANVQAGEGMWILSLIGKNYEQMKAMGFKLTPEEIYSINQACLKDAVISLNHGECTGEFVSAQGLFFTNYHCGFEDIQSQSSVLHDYLTDGFWAKNLSEELPLPGKTISMLISIEDVTSKVIPPNAKDLSPKALSAVIEGNIAILEDDYSDAGQYEVEVANFFDGNNYYLFKYLVYSDVRLVGAPPQSIGQFGGETDNWMWPRQTVDFSVFRVYTAPDGSPAEYSDKNIPLKPKKYLKINAKGISEGDFAMVIGYPGETMRQYSSWQVAQDRDNLNTICVEAFGKKLQIVKPFMEENDEIRIQYSSKYDEDCNAYKCYKGMNVGIANLNVIERKQNLENRLSQWIAANSKKEYSSVLKSLKKLIVSSDAKDKYNYYWELAIYSGCEFVKFGLSHFALYRYLSIGDQRRANFQVQHLKETYQKHFRDYNPEVDHAVSEQMLKYYAQHVPKKYCPKGIDNEAFYELLSLSFSNSFLTSKAEYEKFLDDPTLDKFSNDLLFQFSMECLKVMDKMAETDSYFYKMEYYQRLYTKAMMEMIAESSPDTLFSPDANSTMRLTYGQVRGYAYNGKDMGWYTDFDSYIAKKNNADREFMVCQRLQDLYDSRDFGPYAQDGSIRTCFLTDNDITGGNSGSPVLNGSGELIGLAFDGNWESMSCDIIFEPAFTRTICVDIRMVLFIIDKFAGAKNIIDELDIEI